MKKIILLLLISILAFGSCSKDNEVPSYAEQLAIDVEKITDYLEENQLIAESTSSGVYYIIEEEGIGSYPTLSSLISVEYAGKFLNGSVFDSGTLTDYPLAGLIQGWKEGLQLFKEGTRGKLFIPSGLGYGVADYGPISGNSVLMFDIQLLTVSDAE